MISFDDEDDYAILIMFFSRGVDCFTALVNRFLHPRRSILRDLSGGMKDVEHCRSNAEPEADVADTPDLLFRILQQIEFFTYERYH